jgi:hypothetical protein
MSVRKVRRAVVRMRSVPISRGGVRANVGRATLVTEGAAARTDAGSIRRGTGRLAGIALKDTQATVRLTSVSTSTSARKAPRNVIPTQIA